MEKAEKLDLEIVERMLTPLAWDKLSEEFAWTEELLEKYRERVKWSEISRNRNIVWNTSMIEKFKEDIDWEQFSYHNGRYATLKNLRLFKEYWHWSNLSENAELSWSENLLEEFADKWDWEKIIGNWYLEPFFSMEFVIRYQKHIPFALLHDSMLKNKLVDEIKERLVKQMMETE